jgi:hypothetical protein
MLNLGEQLEGSLINLGQHEVVSDSKYFQG